MTSPTRSRSSDVAAASLRSERRRRERSASRSVNARRSPAYSAKSPRSHAMAPAYPSSASSAFRSCRARPTTAGPPGLGEGRLQQLPGGVTCRPAAPGSRPCCTTAGTTSAADRYAWRRGRRRPSGRGLVPRERPRAPRRRCRVGRPGRACTPPGVRSAWVSPFHLESLSMTTDRAGMLMPSGPASRWQDDLHQPLGEELDTLLEHRQHAGVAATPRANASCHSS